MPEQESNQPRDEQNQPQAAEQQDGQRNQPGSGQDQTRNQDRDDEQDETQAKPKSPLGWIALAAMLLLALIVATVAITRAVVNPRTDDAEVLANYIGMAPQVDGPITQLPIHDNEFVKAGDLLFVIDERPYEYALERAKSQQAALEGQIEDRQRTINSQISGVHVARANIASSASNRGRDDGDHCRSGGERRRLPCGRAQGRSGPQVRCRQSYPAGASADAAVRHSRPG